MNHARIKYNDRSRQQFFAIVDDSSGKAPEWPPVDGQEYLRIVSNEASSYPEFFTQEDRGVLGEAPEIPNSSSYAADNLRNSFNLIEGLVPRREQALEIAKRMAKLRSEVSSHRQATGKKCGIGSLLNHLKEDLKPDRQVKMRDDPFGQDDPRDRNSRDTILETMLGLSHVSLHKLIRQHIELISPENISKKDLICFFGYLMCMQGTLRDEEAHDVRVLCKKLMELRHSLSHLSDSDVCIATINLIIIAVSFTFGQHDLYPLSGH